MEQGFGHRASRLALRLLLLYLRLAPQPKAAAFAQPGAQLLGSLLNPQAAASRLATRSLSSQTMSCCCRPRRALAVPK